MKSAVPQTSTNSTQTAANAVLCTDNQTYQVRQVQSSNSVFVLQPSESIQASTNDSISVTSISAIAQCAVTLELVPASPSPAAYLKQTIPAYLGSESLSASRSAEAIGIDAIIRNMPFSSGECNIAWKELCGFELEGQALLPSASALVHIWESISSAAALSGACLSGSFSLDTIGRPVQEDGHAHDLFRAVIDRLCSENVGIEDGRGFLSCSSVINAERTEDVVLDRHLAISWVGSTLLESLDVSGKGSQVSEFINKWQNLLPEAWRKCVSLGLLKACWVDYFTASNHADSVVLGQVFSTFQRQDYLRRWGNRSRYPRRQDDNERQH